MATKVTRAKHVANQRVRKLGSKRAKAHDDTLLAQAAKEDQRPPSALDVGDAREKLRLACDQIGFALAGARQQEDFDTVDNLTPILASVWSARMCLGDVPEVTP